MNRVYAIIGFLCVQELAAASFYRVPKRYYISPWQERKQTKNAPMNQPARNLQVLPTPDKTQIITEETVTVKPETTEKLINEEHLNEEQIPILKPCQPVLRQDLPIMTTLPILTILPFVASLPVVNIRPRVTEELTSLDDVDNNVSDESLDFEEIEEVEEIGESVSVNILQEVKYEIIERKPRKSPILHKLRRIEEFKRNIFIDRQRDKSPSADFY